MAITKTTEVDKIEIVGLYKTLQVRQATVIKEDGVEISRTFYRYSLPPDADISNEPSDIQNVCNAVWTQEIKDAYAADINEGVGETTTE
ncbi:hypothetical protein HTVC309P_gp40 [Pelagibacter phage HTVC309P]|nr:hypothetical protein HTVC309P_gp40 [Pelagibacter phage HTVC309P]